MSENKNYYQILGIDKNATEAEIKKAYKKLSLKYHPDKNRGKEEWAKGKFIEVGEAYSVLSDSNKRSQYDNYGSTSEYDFNDLFGQMFCSATQEQENSTIGWFIRHGVGSEELDPSLWEPYNNWVAKLQALKDKPAESKAFLDSLWKAIEKVGEKKRKEQEEEWKREHAPWQDCLDSINEVLWKKVTVTYQYGDWPIYVNDFDLDSNLWTPCPNWIDKIYKLELHELDGFRDQMIENIEKVRKDKIAEKEAEKTEQEQKEQNNKQKKEELDLRQRIQTEITQRICHEPYTIDLDLDSNLWSPYKSWLDKVYKIEISQLEDFKKQMLDAIDKDKQKFQKERIDRIYEESKSKNGSDLEEAINNVEKERGSEAYENDKEKIREMKKRVATEDVENYRKKFIKRLKEDMKREGISVHDLEDENALERCNNIRNSSELVEAEMIIVSQVEKVKADKGLDRIINQIKQVLNSVASQGEVEKVKNKILEFISSPNIYCQSAYSNQRSEVQSLLSRLDNYSAPETIDPNNGLSLKVVLPIVAILVFVVLLGVSFVRQKNKRRY